MSPTTDISRPRFARMYLKASVRAERRGASEHRRRLLEGLGGRVLEIGAGNGLNFPHYPSTVTEVIAVEPEPTLRAAAIEAAERAPVPVTVREGTAEAVPLADGEVDAAVASLVLCSVPDQALALAELHRVLRAGGELRFYEHVIANRQPDARDPQVRRAQRPVARHRRWLSPGAGHAGGDRGRRLRDRAMRAIPIPCVRHRAKRAAHPRGRFDVPG